MLNGATFGWARACLGAVVYRPPMAFDGPTPFDGDPAWDWLDEIKGESPAAVQAALERTFEAVIDSEEDYIDVDDVVWAWAAAELVALAIGRGSEPAPPEEFAVCVAGLPDASELVDPALRALAVVADPERSEVADLWNDSGDSTLEEHLADLRGRLGG